MNTRFSLLRTGLTLLTAAALTLCAGCGQHPAETPGSTPSASSSAPAQPDAPAAEAITRLNSFSGTSVPQMGLLSENELLVCDTEYSDELNDQDYYDSKTYLSVIDLTQDTVLRSTEVDTDYDLQQTFSDGTGLLTSYGEDGAHYYRCSPELEITELELPESAGVFSSDGRFFYYISGEVLYRYNLSNATAEKVDLDYDLRFNYVDAMQPDGVLLSCSVYLSYFTVDTYRAVINVNTGALVVLQDSYLPLNFTPSGMNTFGYDYDAENFRIASIPVGGGTLSYSSLPVTDDALNSYYEMQAIPGTDYLISSYDPNSYDGEAWAEEDGGTEQLPADPHATLYRLTDDAMESCYLTDLGIPGMVYTACPLTDGTLLCTSYQDSSCTLYRVDPAQLTFERQELTQEESVPAVDESLLDKFLSEQESPLLAGDLSGVRTQADAIAAKYDVDILLSNTCAPACDASGYQVTTSDQAGWSNEAATIARALSQLDEALAVYPEGFFSQFRTSSENSGVCFLLTGPIVSESGPSSVAAFQYTMRQRYYVCVDMTYYDLTENYYHELWHAIEGKLSNDNADSAFYSDWDALNPPGFSYDYGFDAYDAGTDAGQWTLYGGTDTAYFVDDYARTFPSEDRARIMETVMGDDFYAQQLMESEPLRAKLRLMCDAVRADFDTTGWDTPAWEKYF